MTNLSDLVGSLAKQALSNSSNDNQSQSGFGSILGSVLGQAAGNSSAQQTQDTGLNSIFGSVLGQVLGGNSAQGSGNNAILMAVIPLILNWIQQQGGLQGALSKLQSAGLASQVQNWVDPNQTNTQAPVEQVQQLFDAQDVQNVAQQTQSSVTDVYSSISNLLPQVIDSLTPQGDKTNTDEANQDIQNMINLASQFLKR